MKVSVVTCKVTFIEQTEEPGKFFFRGQFIKDRSCFFGKTK